MFLLIDLLYLLILPLLLFSTIVSRLRGHPPRRGIMGRIGLGDSLPEGTKRILIHAVSVGEVNAIRDLVETLSKDGYQLVISVTTDTGIARASELFGDVHHVVRYPLDFSWSVKKFLSRINPVIIVLVELEVWPNLLRVADRRKIPVVVVNGRLSDRSYKQYQKVSCFLRSTFGRLSIVGMQNEPYANKVSSLGASNVQVLGTMKWDNAIIRDSVPESKELATSLGIDLQKPLIVAGSTTPEEHVLLRNSLPDDVQLLVAPRRPEWFESAEEVLAPCNRRTKATRTNTRFFVLDTIGELTAAYSLATIVVIGRSFSPLHGSDPTEPIGLGKPTIIGPNIGDFSDIVHALLEGKGMIQCTGATLKNEITTLLADKSLCNSLAENGRKIIASNQGATQRYVRLIEEAMSS